MLNRAVVCGYVAATLVGVVSVVRADLSAEGWLAAGHSAPGRWQGQSAGGGQTLADLPVLAQAAISAAIGRDQAAYHAVRSEQGYRLDNEGHGLSAHLTAAGVEVGTG